MRRLELDLKRRAGRNPVAVRALERALEVVAGPGDENALAERVVSEEVTTLPYHPANVLAAAGLFGHHTARKAAKARRTSRRPGRQ